MNQAQSSRNARGPVEPQSGQSGNETLPSQPLGASTVPSADQLHQNAGGSSSPLPASVDTHIPTVNPPAATTSTNNQPVSHPQSSQLPAVNGTSSNNFPVQTNGNASASSTPQRPEPQKKTFLDFCWSMKGPISLIVVYAITTYIISTAGDVNGPLARSGVTGGFLLLNVLALLNNYALLAAGDKAWQYTQWSERFMRRGQNLTDFLALSNSSGVSGWARICFHDSRPLKRMQRLPANLPPFLQDFLKLLGWRPGTQAGTEIRTRTPQASMGRARFWGLSR